ncbi:glycosyltransferase family 4 protein [Bradyrhizobium symbiodeficiens]|uniref:Glycosyltransferase family 4 protein n=1 Tax=Bradyrhizobium symbiodeficiens TaxID=1404367 RepID=A0ABX5W1D6_9BRAD|nr:glycosyltransferase family 4 protein [Bradyrhizobium symbiodeficiens]AWM05878.1 glycosyltransferase WbuB [Bradyrhizobium symbiodeficiens]QDF36252.1 glycosyltransferase family 4 protein [Bradyrhizobium symbiodeficiens]
MVLAGDPFRPKRILIIVENLPVPFDRRVWNEATTLVKAGYEVSVICPVGHGASARREVIDGVHIYRHPIVEARSVAFYFVEYAVALFWEFFLAWRVLFERGFDAIHACNPPDLIFLVGGFFKLFLGKKFVFDHHDINPELFEAKFGKRNFLYRIVVALERCTFAVADISIATNHSYRTIAVERGKMDPNNVFIVRSGPNLERLKIVPPDPSVRKGRAYCVGYVGVLGAQEGINYLLEAARHIVYDVGRHDIQFCIAGGGPELERLRALAVELGVADYVTFAGRVSDDELLRILNTADVCVNSDEWNPMNDKSTMNKIMEYMALAKPIVQFDLTEGRFTALDASLYAKPNDSVDFAAKILDLLGDESRRKQLGEFGRRRVIDQLAWPHEAPKLLGAYRALFEGKVAVHGQSRGQVTRTDRGDILPGSLMRRLLSPLASRK